MPLTLAPKAMGAASRTSFDDALRHVAWQSFCNVLHGIALPEQSPLAEPAALKRHSPRAWSCTMKSILDPTFRYTSSANTDLRKTFARIRRESRRQSQPASCDDADGAKKVTPIFRGQRPAA